MKIQTSLMTLILVFTGLYCTSAQVPEIMNYQGRVVVNETNFNGIGFFKFALVDQGMNTAVQAEGTASVTSKFVTSVAVTEGGSGYASAPSISFIGGGGSGAVAHALISGGVVTSISVDNAGSGYTSIPSVVIDPPAGSITYTTYWSNDETASGEPASSVSLNVDGGLFSVLLGDTSHKNMVTLPASVFTTADLSLRVWFSDGGSFEELTPDQRLATVPYAMNVANSGKLHQIITVGAGGDHTSISDALTAITDNAEDKLYVIKVGPGRFEEPILIMKPYVSIQGSGLEVTTIFNTTGITNFNTQGAVIASVDSSLSDISIIATNALVAFGNHATALFVGNMGTNDFLVKNVLCEAYGGYTATGIYCRDASPRLENIYTEASGDKYSYGIYLYNSFSTIETAIAIVSGADWGDTAIIIFGGAPYINNAECRTTGDDALTSANDGINISGAAEPILNNVIAWASAVNGANKGIKCSGTGTTPTLTNCKIIGEDSSGDNHGLYQFGATVKVHNSLIKGATAALHVSNNGATTFAANCQVDGPQTTQFGAVLTTVHCYDESFIAIP